MGVEAVYTAQSRSLAALEILVHYSVLPKDFVVTPVRIPELLIREIPQLPTDWQTNLAATREIGTALLSGDLSCAVLSVPSSIVPAERNYVLNPNHPRFSEIEFLASESFHFDPRLKQ